MTERYYPATYKVPTEEIIGSGGGGCFPAGTLVFTAKGYKPIELIKAGDLIVAYDRDGNAEHGLVTQTFIHPIQENPTGLYTFTYGADLTLSVTGNHAIFFEDAEISFKEAKDFKIGEHFTDLDGLKHEIKDINFVPQAELPLNFKSYNFEVEPQHVYYVTGSRAQLVPIRVHNGGGGGKGGGQQRVAQEDPNTLRSTALARVVEVLSEGEIVGLVNGAQSIYFNETPVQNGDSTYNFENVVYDIRNGTPSQDYLPGFADVEAETLVNTDVTFGSPVTHSISDVDAARITIALPQGLHKQDTTTGDLHGFSVTIAIDTRPTGGSFTEVVNQAITGKTMTPYETAWRVERPSGATTWDVRVRRVSANDVDSSTQSITYFSRYTEITDIKLGYDDTAYIGIIVDSKSTGGDVPARSYDIKGIKVKIPNNYNPVTRAYTGDWSGTFITAWTDNPAWIIYDLLTNTRYGLGNYIDESTIDKFSFYTVAQYNDGLVDDGNGGTEPRFTFNTVIATREDCWKLIQSVASACRSVVLPGGIVKLIQDSPSSAVKIVNNANVENGLFNYTSTGLQARHTACNVTFNDASNNYLPRTITVEDTDGINRYGYNADDTVAYGAVTEGQARRFALWVLDTELNTTEVVTYHCGFNQADLNPGDIIDLMDNDYAGGFFAGRIAGGTTTSITLDRTVTLKSGATYTLDVLGLDGTTLLSRTVTSSAGDHSSLTVSVAFPNTGVELQNREWMIHSTGDVSPRKFRVVNVKEIEKGKFEVVASFYDPDKFARVEGGITNPTPVFSNLTFNQTGIVTDLTATQEAYIDPVLGPKIALRIDWDAPTTALTTGYKFKWRKDSGQFSRDEFVEQPSFTIKDATQGVYDVQVIAVNLRGVQSAPVLQTFTIGYSGTNGLNPPTAIDLQSGHGTAGEFFEQDMFIQWTPDPANAYVVGSVVGGYQIKIYDNDTSTLLRSDTVGPSIVQYDYTYVNNLKDGGPYRHYEVQVFTLDGFNRPSVSHVTGNFVNEAPDIPDTITFDNLPDGFVVKTTGITEIDASGIIVWLSSSNGFTPADDNKAYDGANVPEITFNKSVGTYYLRLAVYDNYSKAELNVSSQYSIDVLGAYPIPGVPTGLALTSVVTSQPNGSQTADITATWNANSDDHSGYTIELRDITGSGQFITSSTTGTNYKWTGLKCANTYGVDVRADNHTSHSAFSSEITKLTPGDTTPPGDPTGLTATASFKNIWLNWVNPTDADLAGIQVYHATVNNRASATLIATVFDNTYTHSGLTTGTTHYYWIRAIDTSGNTSQYQPLNALTGVSATTSSVATADYANLSIVNAAIANLAVDNAKIADATITGAKIGTLTVDTINLKNGAITDPMYVYDNTTYSLIFPSRSAAANSTSSSAGPGTTTPAYTNYIFFTTPTVTGMTEARCFISLNAPFNYSYFTETRLMNIGLFFELDKSNDGLTGWTSVDTSLFSKPFSGISVVFNGSNFGSLSSYQNNTRLSALFGDVSALLPMGKFFRLRAKFDSQLDVWTGSVSANTCAFLGLSWFKQLILK